MDDYGEGKSSGPCKLFIYFKNLLNFKSLCLLKIEIY